MNYETKYRARLVRLMNNANERAETLMKAGQNVRAFWWCERSQMYADEIKAHDEIFLK